MIELALHYRLIELALHYHHSSSRVVSTSPLERVNHGGQDNTFWNLIAPRRYASNQRPPSERTKFPLHRCRSSRILHLLNFGNKMDDENVIFKIISNVDNEPRHRCDLRSHWSSTNKTPSPFCVKRIQPSGIRTQYREPLPTVHVPTLRCTLGYIRYHLLQWSNAQFHLQPR